MTLLAQIENFSTLGQKALALLAWWIDELGQFWNNVVTGLGIRQDSHLVFEINDDRLDLVSGHDYGHPDHRVAGKLLLPEKDVLIRRTIFPNEARGILDEAVAQFAKSVCPFDPIELVYGWSIVASNVEDGEIEIAMALLPRSRVHSLTSAADKCNVELTHLQCDLGGAHIEFSLLQPRQVVRRLMCAKWFKLGAAIALLLMSGFYLEQKRVSRNTEMLSAFIESKRDELFIIRKGREELNALTNLLVVHETRISKVSIAQVLSDLSDRLPDHTHLTAFQVVREEIVLDGISQNAAELLPTLEASPFIQSATFESEIRSANDTGKQGFRLKLERVVE